MVQIIKVQTEEIFEWEEWRLVKFDVPDAELEYIELEEVTPRAAA